MMLLVDEAQKNGRTTLSERTASKRRSPFFFLAIVGAVLAAVAGTIAFPGSAYAATSEAVVSTNGTPAGKAWFNYGPDYFTIRDTKCDKKEVRVYYRLKADGQKEYSKEIDNGFWVETGCNTEMNFSIDAGPGKIKYRICVGNWRNGLDEFWRGFPDCSKWVYDGTA